MVSTRVEIWFSMAVLVMGIAAPLRGVEMTSGGSDPRAGSGMVWDSDCGAIRRDATLQGDVAGQTPQPGRLCSLGPRSEVTLVETAELLEPGWIPDRVDGSFGVPRFVGGGSFNQISNAQVASIVADLATARPTEKPAGAKVPEPATLVLLGAGLIATSGLSRIKRQPKNLLRLAAVRLVSALQ